MTRELVRRMEALGAAVYAEGQVPDGAQFPYVTFRLSPAALGEAGSGNLTCWTQDDHVGCLALAGMITTGMGRHGTLLTFTGGAMQLVWKQMEPVQAAAGVEGIKLSFTLHGMMGEEESDADGDP